MRVDPLARVYRWLEYAAFGRTLEKSRFQFLPELGGARRILMLGEGDGRALAKLVALVPDATIDVVEQSPAMTALARRRVRDFSGVHFFEQDLLAFPFPPMNYDAAVACFVLDCFDAVDAAALLGRIHESLRPGATLLITDFAEPRKGWRRQHARAWVHVMYFLFRWTTGLEVTQLPPIERLVQQAGFAHIQSRTWRASLIESTLWRRL